jgi:ribonuclease T1
MLSRMPGAIRVALALVVALSTVSVAVFARGSAPPPAAEAKAAIPEIALAELPREARETLELIRRGGPFPYERDGAVFGNFEKRLPSKERGYYREYTVPTPGLKHRGARRIVSGRGGEHYYTDDHYRSFRRIKP